MNMNILKYNSKNNASLFFNRKYEALPIRKCISHNGCLLWLLMFSETGKRQLICSQQIKE